MPPESGARDRLSALPEGVLHAVLSFLPARQAVQTSVLSRSWKNLWRSMPRIAIDEREFGVDDSLQRENWDRFENFATNLLSSHCSSSSSFLLDKFRIYVTNLFQIYTHGQTATVKEWIRRGIECFPAVLEIQTPYYAVTDRFKPLVFPCLGSPLYGRLKRIHLVEVELAASFNDLLTSCSALVDLELVCCFNRFRHIASDTLKRLVIDSCRDFSRCLGPAIITAPSLASLELGIDENSCPSGIAVCNTASLAQASIYIRSGRFFSSAPWHADFFPDKNERMLLGSLFNVTNLVLNSFKTLGMRNENSDIFPTFPNLRDLSLEGCFVDYERDVKSKFEDLRRFLENASCLEKLTLLCCMPEADWKSISLQHQDGKTFKCPKLKLIEVMYNDKQNLLPIQLLWGIGRSLPDARVILTKI